MSRYHNNIVTACILAGLLASSPGHAVYIDAFSPVDHANDFAFGNKDYVNRSYVHSYAAPVAGGERDLEFVQVERTFVNPPQFFARFEQHELITGEFYRVGARGPGAGNGTTNGKVTLQYDGLGDETGNIGLDRRLNNSGSGELRFEPLGGFRMLVNSNRATRALPATAILRRQGIEVARQTRLLVSLDRSFAPILFPFTADQLTQSDSLTFEFDTQTGGDGVTSAYIKHIETIVPEPSAGLVVLGGLGLLALRQRKSR